jgi:hypothetical protein
MLVAVLLLAQTVGWMHRGLHGTAPAHGSAATALHVHAGVAKPHAPRSWIEKLFGSHTDASDCRLFDVLGQPGCASAALLPQPLIPMATLLVTTHADFVARWAALFDARGPPASR